MNKGLSEVEILSTGKQIDRLVLGLIQSADDKQKDVQQAVSDAILKIGCKHVDLVLTSCLNYLVVNLKQLSQNHRIHILITMERVIKENVGEIGEKLAVQLIKQATTEMVSSKDIVPEWQEAASKVLVAIGTRYCVQVMDELMLHFQPGVLPHFFVVQTMGQMASSNPYGMVPFVQVVVATMLPLLGMAKLDNMKWVFAHTLSRFAEAILFYIVNIDQAPDKNVRRELFANEFFSAFDLLFNVWLPNAKEQKLRVNIVTGIGHIAHIISKDQLKDQLPKLIPGIMSLYKKQMEHLPITEGLCLVLEAATADGARFLDGQLDTVLRELHQLICQHVDSNNAQQVKNHNELLRCFSVINQTYSDKVVANLLQRLEAPNEKTRIGVLMVVRQLVNSSGSYMDTKKALIVSGLRILLTETNCKVKKVFAQTVIAMAHQGYLELEGGELMVEFIVKQCALPDEGNRKRETADPDYVTSQALRSMCESVLQLITTTISIMEKVLWPYLLEFLIPVQYTDAAAVLCRSIHSIAEKKRLNNDVDYLIEYEEEVNIPRPDAIIARLFVLSGLPMNGNKRGEHILSTMQSLVPNLRDELVPIWDDVIPKLLTKLREMEDEESFNQKKWEDLVLRLLSTSLGAVDDEDWVVLIGKAFGDQLSLYKDYPAEKNFALKCLGVVLRRSRKNEFIQTQMDVIFSQTSHSSDVEQEGAAAALGFMAASHFDTVLNKMETSLRSEPKSKGIVGIFKDALKSDSGDQERLKQTIVLAYGYVTLYAPITLVTSRVEAVIFRNIQPFFSNQKETVLKQNLIHTIELIAKSMDPVHLQKAHELTQRRELIDYLLACMRSEPSDKLTGKIRPAVLDACSALIKLDPILPPSELFDVIKTCLDSVFCLPSNIKHGKPDSFEEQMQLDQLMMRMLSALQDMLQQILAKEFSPSGLQNIIKHILPWVVSVKDHERERSVWALHHLLKFFQENLSDSSVAGNFLVLGECVGNFIPRCTDPSIQVREEAILGLQVALRIELRYQGVSTEKGDKMVDALPVLKERLQKSDASVLFSAVNDLSKVIARKFPKGEQLINLLDVLMERLNDSQPLCSNGACVVLNGIVKLRGAELVDQVEAFLSKLHSKLQVVTVEQTKLGALRCVKSLATYHLDAVLGALLKYPLPFSHTIKEFWLILAKEPALLTQIVSTFLSMLHQHMPYEERASPSDRKLTIRVATSLPLSIITAFQHLFEPEESKDTICDHYCGLVAALLLKLGAYAGTQPPDATSVKKNSGSGKKPDGKAQESRAYDAVVPSKIVISTMHQFFKATSSPEMLEAMVLKPFWEKLDTEQGVISGLEHIVGALVIHKAHLLKQMVECLRSATSSLYDTDRIVVTTIFGKLIHVRCAGDMELAESVIGFLMGQLVDSNITVRMLCVRGLGNIAGNDNSLVQKYSTSVLSAMISGMDDKDDVNDLVTLEAMSGLSKVLASISESQIRPILINVALKIKPCFEKDQASVRAAAFELFGNLSKFGNGPSAQPFAEQINGNLTALLLHLNDREEVVIKACKHALKLIGPLLESSALNDMFQKHLIDNANLHYGEFLNDLCKVLVKDYDRKIAFFVMANITYFRSQWPEIKGNAAIYLGFLMNGLTESAQSQISKDHISNALLELLKDQDPTVRCKAAEAISLLTSY